jgi:hypothetical protein
MTADYQRMVPAEENHLLAEQVAKQCLLVYRQVSVLLKLFQHKLFLNLSEKKLNQMKNKKESREEIPSFHSRIFTKINLVQCFLIIEKHCS